MRNYAFTLFGTAIGSCALAWSGPGIVAVQLPESDKDATRRRVLERFPDAREALPPAVILAARDAIIALLRGERVDLSGVALDTEAVPNFHRRVYEVARTIAPGTTVTYGALARAIGAAGAARAVGRALSKNPFPIVVPCHRVLGASGKLFGTWWRRDQAQAAPDRRGGTGCADASRGSRPPGTLAFIDAPKQPS